MSHSSPTPAPKARVLSNMRLPDVEGYAIRCFGDYLPPRPPGAPPWRAEMERRNLADILPLIPAAETPDILVCASPEYLPIPWDIHAFPGPKVLLITDWNVCLRFLPDLVSALRLLLHRLARLPPAAPRRGRQRLPSAPVRA